MLTVYRRHNPVLCKSTDRYYKRCTCPAWVEGTVGGKYVRLSLKTHSWERAVAKVRTMDATEDPIPASAKKDEPVTIERAVNEYLADAKARELGEATLYKLNIIFHKQLLMWSKAEGYKLLREFDLRAVQAYRATWKDGALAKKKKQERLTGFFWFCIRAGWITQNPTNGLGRITVNQTPTDYFTRKEFDEIIDATYAYRENRGETGSKQHSPSDAHAPDAMEWFAYQGCDHS